MNPTVPSRPRLAVALQYDGENAPTVTAKGHGEVAEAILAAARAHEIPIREAPELARVLATIDLDAEIPAVLYRAVAEIIAFAYLLKDRSPADPGR
ncbi:MAG: EscU/YscU/HrcU family type III secretion system export apparatus switch protein [Gammaproteobacteria bacterium]|nr:EscU/YscU/HrcU family type III secretion system export apparatus switch protein [Gammaproteobacteria bacterium]